MGKYEKGILGPFNGKVGTVIGSQWKGISYMRSLPRKSGKAATAKQLDVQRKFLLVTGFLKPISGLIVDGYKNIKGSLTPLNYAVSYHLKYAVIGESPDFTIDPTKVLISSGELTGFTEPDVVNDAPLGLHFTWDTESLIGTAKDDDVVSALIYEESTMTMIPLLNATTRSTGELITNLPAALAGKTVQCYLSIKSKDAALIATSTYLGAIEVVNV